MYHLIGLLMLESEVEVDGGSWARIQLDQMRMALRIFLDQEMQEWSEDLFPDKFTFFCHLDIQISPPVDLTEPDSPGNVGGIVCFTSENIRMELEEEFESDARLKDVVWCVRKGVL